MNILLMMGQFGMLNGDFVCLNIWNGKKNTFINSFFWSTFKIADRSRWRKSILLKTWSNHFQSKPSFTKVCFSPKCVEQKHTHTLFISLDFFSNARLWFLYLESNRLLRETIEIVEITNWSILLLWSLPWIDYPQNASLFIFVINHFYRIRYNSQRIYSLLENHLT